MYLLLITTTLLSTAAGGALGKSERQTFDAHKLAPGFYPPIPPRVQDGYVVINFKAHTKTSLPWSLSLLPRCLSA